MKKRTILIAGLSLLATGLTAAALTGCKGYKFEEYSYNYGGESEKDWRALEYPDQSIKMDGLVNVGEYGKNHLSFSDVNGVNMKVYAHLGEEGVFFGFVSNDTLVNYNPKNDVFNNTSVEIQVAPNGTETLNSNVVQLRLGANGTPDQWVGFPADDMKYAYTKKYIPSMGVVHIDGELNDRADGYSVELYLPYTSIGLSEKPESVVCAPSFNTMPNPYNSTRATWTMMLGCDLAQPATWYVVDETGMTAHTAGFTSKGANVSQSKGYNEFYYFDTAPSESYYLKSEVTVTTTTKPFLNNDNFPKFGLVNKSENALQAFYIDAANGTGTNFGTVRAIQSTAGGTNWQWNNNASTSIEGHWGNSYIGNYRNKQLETIYYEGDLYFILDGVLVKTVKNFAPQSDGAVPGLMCFNTKATFTKNEFETDPTKVKAEVEKYLAKEAKIDGDLSDWTNADVNRHAKTVADGTNGNSMTVRAFRGSDGLYIAYEVAHRVNLTPSKWDEGWWNNTNVELYVNGTGEKNHYALTTFGSGGYMDGAMITTRNEDRTYSTVAEIFIPFTSLERDGFNKNDTLNVGFAFKSTNNTADSNLHGKDWWAIEGTPTSVQLSVLEKGIGEEYTVSYSAGEESGVTGTAPAEQIVFAGDRISLAANTFIRSGYTFIGWSDGSNGYAAGEEYLMPRNDVTLTACWIADSATGTKYGVVYADDAADSNGTLPTDEQTYAEGELVTLAQAELTREGYRFAGWSYGGKTYVAGSKIFMGSGVLTLTAVWEKVYTLSYAAGGSGVEGTLPETMSYANGDTVEIKLGALTRNGYDFFGWECSFNHEVYAAGEIFAMPDEDVTFTAVWKSTITIDGNLTDWNAIGSKTIGAHSINSGDNRKATWYGVLRDDGLYLAVDIYHNNLGSGQGDWWKNLNFEIHLGAQNLQHYVYVKNFNAGLLGIGATYTIEKSSGDFTAAYNYASGLTSGTTHHSTFEVFFPNSMISGLKETDGSIRIGVAIKTDDNNEKITGGSYEYAGGDAWYAPYGVLVNVYDQFAYVTKDGMYLKNEYEHSEMQFGTASATANAGITLDGDISEWTSAAGKTLSVVGTDLVNYAGKSVTFYGKMTQSGLYLAVEAYHGDYVIGQSDWWNNTNFELRIGEVFGSTGNLWAKQYYVYATGEVGTNAFRASESYMQISSKTERISNHGSANYHTVIEVFISAANLVQYDYMVQNGMIHVGVAWKTPGDDINNNSASVRDVDSWWQPKDTFINTNPTCVNGNGIYTAKEYAALAD